MARARLLVTDPQRTLVDLGLVAPTYVVDRAVTVALTSKLLQLSDLSELRDALARPGRNGTGVLKRVLARRTLTAKGEESVLEARFVDLLNRFGLAVPELQHEVWSNGRFVARVDCAYVKVKLAMELDGLRWHSDRARSDGTELGRTA